jgi:hypothetical protein
MYFDGSFSQIYRRLYSVGRGSVVEWVLSVPSKVRFSGSFGGTGWDLFISNK